MSTIPQSVTPAGRVAALSLSHVWVVCGLILVFSYVCSPSSFALDLWQHLSLGREMVRTGQLVEADSFAHILAGQPVLNQNWLSEVVLYLCYRVGGVEGVSVFVAGLYTLAYGVLMYVCWTRSQHTRIAVGCALLAAAIGCENLSVRTQVFSALCLSLQLWVLWTDDFKKWRPLAVAAIVVLWTNTHGAFALGVVLPVIFTVGRAIAVWEEVWGDAAKRKKRRSSGERRTVVADFMGEGSRWIGAVLADGQFRSFALAAMCAAAASFCNPRPGQTIHYVFANIDAGFRRNIEEWQPIPFASVTGKFFYGSVALVLLVLSWSRKRLDVTEAILLFAFLCLGAKAWRMAMWWGFVLAPVLARHLATLLPSADSASAGADLKRGLAGGGASGGRRIETGRGSLLNWAFLVFLLAMAGLSLPWFKEYNPMLPPARRAAVPPDEPQALVVFLKERGAAGNGFNPMEWGGYLMCHFDGRLKVFVDGRIDPFPDAVWSDYEAISAARADWEELLRRYQVTTLIASRQKMPALIHFADLSPRWKQVYSDELAVVFEAAPQN